MPADPAYFGLAAFAFPAPVGPFGLAAFAFPAPVGPTVRGGTARRRYAVGRVLRRSAAGRALARRHAAGRTLRGSGGTLVPITETVLPKAAAEVVAYVADYTAFPEAAAHALSGASAAATPAGLTVGAPVVLTEETDGIPAGKGARVAVSGGTPGVTYTLTVLGTFADTAGSVRAVRALIEVE